MIEVRYQDKIINVYTKEEVDSIVAELTNLINALETKISVIKMPTQEVLDALKMIANYMAQTP